MPPTRCYTLANGLKVRIFDRCDQEVNRLTVVWPGGSAEGQATAVARLAVSLLRDGSRCYTGQQISERLDYNGSWLKFSTLAHHNVLMAYSLNSRLDYTLPVIADLAFYPTFPEAELRLARERIASLLSLQQKEMTYYASKQSAILAMGPNHPLAQEPSPEAIRSLECADVMAFHNKWGGVDGATLFLTGRISPEIENKVMKTFERVECSSPKAPQLTLMDFEPDHSSPLTFIERPEAKQNSVQITLPAIRRGHPDYALLRLAVTALGGYFGSRLMMNLREDKGYTYGISALLLGYLDDSLIQIQSECDSRNVEPLIEEVYKEVRRMGDTLLSDDEMMRLRQTETTSLLDTLDSPFSIMDFHQSVLTSGITPEYFAQRAALIDSATPEMIRDISRRYLLPEQIITVVAGKK